MSQYDSVEEVINGFHKVRKDNKYGFINRQGEEICPLKYDQVWDFHIISDDLKLAIVSLNDKEGFIDTSGNEIIPLQFDHVYYFTENFAPVIINYKWGLINTQGELVVPTIFEEIKSFENGYAELHLLVNGYTRTFQVDTEGTYYVVSRDKIDCASCKFYNDKLLTKKCCCFN